MQRLSGKVALIIGAGTEIGRASAELFAAEQARVVVAEYDPATGRAAADAIVAAGGEALFVRTDVTDEDSVKAAIDAAVEHFGALHILYNNAGGSTTRDGPVTEAPIEEFWRAIKLDLLGTWLVCRHDIPELVKAGGGSVINAASVVAGQHLLGLAESLDVANAALFLASNESARTTGHVLTVDSGLTFS